MRPAVRWTILGLDAGRRRLLSYSPRPRELYARLRRAAANHPAQSAFLNLQAAY